MAIAEGTADETQSCKERRAHYNESLVASARLLLHLCHLRTPSYSLVTLARLKLLSLRCTLLGGLAIAAVQPGRTPVWNFEISLLDGSILDKWYLGTLGEATRYYGLFHDEAVSKSIY